MKIGLRILLGYFLIVALAALLLGRVFLQEVKPGVRQAMEDTLVDTANLLAEQAKDDLLAGRIADGRFAEHVRALTDRDLGAEIWGFTKRKVSTRIYVTDAAGKLQHLGIIEYSRGHITVLDRPRLEALSCECYAVVKKETDRLLPARTPMAA